MAVASDPNLVFIINCLIRPTDQEDLETTGMEKLGAVGGGCGESRADEGSNFNKDLLIQKDKLQMLELESSENQATFTCSEV